jgi:hypothetical protein
MHARFFERTRRWRRLAAVAFLGWGIPAQAVTYVPPPNPATDGMETFPPSSRTDGLYPDTFFPFIDQFGQFKHLTWGDKVADLPDLTSRFEQEQAERTALQPFGWSQYGGWKHGPRLEPTGFFRRAQIDGRWWLVDPEGYLFFSSGVTTVSSVVRTDVSGASSMRTGITGRENFFENLPPAGDVARTLGLLANETATVTSGEYQGQRPLAANFFAINALRQFPGAASVESLRASTSALAFDRLRSWGFTTIGGWSDPDLFVRPGRRPYTHVLVYTHPGLINGTVTFLDYFRDAFAANLRTLLQAEVGKTIGDPWNIGFYIDNERDWTKSNVTARDLGLTVLASAAEPLERYAKRAFRDQLQAKYGTAAALNAQWGVAYTSWDDFLTRRDVVPAAAGSDADMNAYEILYAETYFRACRDAMRETAPQHLYLGCRFTTGGRAALMQIASTYVDVLTVNIYGSTIRLLNGMDADVPVMSTEFHFFSRDTGLFARAVATSTERATQAERAQAMQAYLASAIAHPRFVGGHWFQYFDYPTSGRLNSRNMNSNLGLVDTSNLPQTAMINAARIINYGMYRNRYAPPTLQPAADTVVSSAAPGQNEGTATTLTVGATSQAFLRFDLSSVASTVERAVLLLTPVAGDSLANHALAAVDDMNWVETSLTWSNRPVPEQPALAQWTTRAGLPVEVDVTPWLRRAMADNRKLSFRLFSTDGSALNYGSKEGDAAVRPQLLLLLGPTSRAAWRSQYFTAGSSVAGDLDDPDRDGIPNLLEYALALSPHQAEAQPGWKFALAEDGRATLTFYRARADVTYRVEVSSDLQTWMTVVTNPGIVGGTVTVTDPTTGWPRRFLRLRVEAP